MTKNISIIILFVSIFLLGGCSSDDHGHPHSDSSHGDSHSAHGGHGHGDGGATIVKTIWTDQTELFVEFPPFISGQPSKFAAHYTYLDTFQPVEKGTLTIRLEGSKTYEVKAKKPARSGIYTPELTAKKPGEYRLIFQLSTPRLKDRQVISSVKVYQSKEAAKKDLGHPHESAQAISFLKEQQWKIDFQTTPVQKGSLAESIRIPGQVKPLWGQSARLLAPTRGQIIPASGKTRLPHIGQKVKKGEVLAQVIPQADLATRMNMKLARRQLKLNELNLAQARIELENRGRKIRRELRAINLKIDQAQRVYDRLKKLVKSQGATKEEVEEARLKVQLLKTSLKFLEERESHYFQVVKKLTNRGVLKSSGKTLDLDESFPIEAPLSGTVVKVLYSQGDSLERGSLLFRIVNMKEVLLQGALYERYAHQATASPGVHIYLPGQKTPQAYSKGSPTYLGQVVNEKNRTLPIYYQVKNKKGLFRLEGKVHLSLELKKKHTGFLISEEALVEENGLYYIFVHTGGETFYKRQIQPLVKKEGKVLVTRGLAKGERVVTEGAYIIWLSTKSSKMSTGHGHPH